MSKIFKPKGEALSPLETVVNQVIIIIFSGYYYVRDNKEMVFSM